MTWCSATRRSSTRSRSWGWPCVPAATLAPAPRVVSTDTRRRRRRRRRLPCALRRTRTRTRSRKRSERRACCGESGPVPHAPRPALRLELTAAAARHPDKSPGQSAERCGELSEPVPCEDPAEEMFIRISKANDACARPAPLCPRTPRALKAAFCLRRLTDPEIRENYEKYGHPVCSLWRGNGAWVLSLTSAGRLRRMGDRP